MALFASPLSRVSRMSSGGCGGLGCGVVSVGVMASPVFGSGLYEVSEGVSPASLKRLVQSGQPFAKRAYGAYQGTRKIGRQPMPAPANPGKGVLVTEGLMAQTFPYGDGTQVCGRRDTDTMVLGSFANATVLAALL
jgi:hypothetical protein